MTFHRYIGSFPRLFPLSLRMARVSAGRDRLRMLDADVVATCAQFLAGAATYEMDESDVLLVAAALTRDLMETHGPDAEELLGAATIAAGEWLDASELDAGSFASAWHCLAKIRGLAQAKLRAGAIGEPRRV